jgi:hypothetical protein
VNATEIAEFFKMTEAEKLFNEVQGRCFSRWTFILSFRITSAASMDAARKELEKQKVTFVNDILHGSDYDKILLDKEAFFKEHPPDKLIAQMTDATIAHSQAAVDAASIIFAHTVLDGAALDYCKVTGLVAPEEWESVIEQRQIKLSDMRGLTYEQLMRRKLDEFFAQLDRESLLKKAEYLFARCKPPDGWTPMNNYAYDGKRLEQLDRYRHNVIHGGSLGKGIAAAEEEVEFLMKTALFFMGLVNLRYGLKLNPLYVITVMQSS